MGVLVQQRKKLARRKNIQIEGQLDFFDLLYAAAPINKLSQFNECENCWCKDCKHNSMNEGEPRDFGGQSKPCPSCEICIDNDKPEVCKIGSSKDGCSLRAKEEGIIEND